MILSETIRVEIASNEVAFSAFILAVGIIYGLCVVGNSIKEGLREHADRMRKP